MKYCYDKSVKSYNNLLHPYLSHSIVNFMTQIVFRINQHKITLVDYFNYKTFIDWIERKNHRNIHASDIYNLAVKQTMQNWSRDRLQNV
jgi:hypothetical protein